MAIKKDKFTVLTQLRPDSKGRISLSKLAEGVSSYNVSTDDDGRILLEPMVEIPAREKWLFENSKALAMVRRGLAESKAGLAVSRGSFAKYAKEDDDD